MLDPIERACVLGGAAKASATYRRRKLSVKAYLPDGTTRTLTMGRMGEDLTPSKADDLSFLFQVWMEGAINEMKGWPTTLGMSEPRKRAHTILRGLRLPQ